MRAFFQKRAVIVLFAAVVAVIAVLFSGFSFIEMGSTSMEPLIGGQGSPPSRRGDTIVVAKWFRVASLRPGDLVVVDIPTPTGRVRTVRRVERRADAPVGCFYLRAESDNGIDSRYFGPLPGSDIKGKVVAVLK